MKRDGVWGLRWDGMGMGYETDGYDGGVMGGGVVGL